MPPHHPSDIYIGKCGGVWKRVGCVTGWGVTGPGGFDVDFAGGAGLNPTLAMNAVGVPKVMKAMKKTLKVTKAMKAPRVMKAMKKRPAAEMERPAAGMEQPAAIRKRPAAKMEQQAVVLRRPAADS